MICDDYYLDGGFTLIDHGQGVSTSYLHQSRRLVQAGDAVKRGQRIGLIGATGPRHRPAPALGDELVRGAARSVAVDAQAEAGAALSFDKLAGV